VKPLTIHLIAVVLLTVVVPLPVLSGCSLQSQPATRLGDLAQDDLTGFRLEITNHGGSRLYRHENKPALTRYIVTLLLEQRERLGENTQVDDTPSQTTSVYTITILLNDGGTTTVRLVNRHWPPEDRKIFLQDGGWYELPQEVLSQVYELASNPTTSMDFDPQHVAFLERYGWHPWSRLNTYAYRLPATFEYQVGRFPTALFWAHRNALSTEIGLDLEPHLGRQVQITIYRLDRDIPYLLPHGGTSRAIIVNHGASIIGAWVDKGRHGGDSIALNEEKTVPDEEFLVQFTDTSDSLVAELASLEPVEVLQTFWEAVDRADYRRAYACFTLESVFGYLFNNMDNSRHANETFSDATSAGGLENFESVEFVGAELLSGPVGPTETEKKFRVELAVDVKKEMVMEDGKTVRYAIVRNTPLGWRTDGLGGTGP